MTGKHLNSSNSINTTPRVCLALLFWWTPMRPSSISCGLMESRQWMPVRKLDVPATGLCVRVRFMSLMKRTQIVSTKPAPNYSMGLRLQRILLYMVPTFPMLSLRLLPRNRDFTSDRIGFFTSGGPSIRTPFLFYLAT